ncbi:MAG: helix-turn-helix domain-containing protein, partial [Actinomycetia bacterium]|nr:helix-turn-helix domain-containing protein [Actinomycetes bacterium]
MKTSPQRVGALVRAARTQRGLSQAQLADLLDAPQSDVHRLEAGDELLSLEMINRIAEALDSDILPGKSATHVRVQGGRRLSGSIEVRSSKNAAVALLCASLLNYGTTTLRGIARIEEVNRLTEVLESIGVSCVWSENRSSLTISRPEELDLSAVNVEAARRTRSVLLFLGPLIHEAQEFRLPYAGGCNLGTRTVEPHLQVLRPFGLEVTATEGFYQCQVTGDDRAGQRRVTLTERGDTVTENALMAAAMTPGLTELRNASPNYMVQDLCAYLIALGVSVEGVGTTTLRIRGQERIEVDVTYDISEDPIEAMSLITAAVVTHSELQITRVPIEFLEIELAVLTEMGLRYSLSEEYLSRNGLTRLVDLTVYPSKLVAAADKIHPMPFPGLNIDNLPFFAVIAAEAEGATMIHDWVYDNRAIHL